MDVMILKIFSPKTLAKKLVFFAQTAVLFRRKLAKNRRKIVMKASTPD
jgi:hypothetical protein